MGIIQWLEHNISSCYNDKEKAEEIAFFFTARSNKNTLASIWFGFFV